MARRGVRKRPRGDPPRSHAVRRAAGGPRRVQAGDAPDPAGHHRGRGRAGRARGEPHGGPGRGALRRGADSAGSGAGQARRAEAGCLLVPEAPAPEARQRLDEVAWSVVERVRAGRAGPPAAGRGRVVRREAVGRRRRPVGSADPARMSDLVTVARDAARALVEQDPTLASHPALARAVRRLLERGAAPVRRRS